jgi:poly(hydroxyalkanoate) depolymerase family esterase
MTKFTMIVLALILTSTTVWSKRIKFPFMGRNFVLIAPENRENKDLPVVVLLHGCKQNPDLVLRGTELETEAIKNNFIVLAPEQSIYKNSDHCWNWFFSYNQERSSVNEMGQIMAALEVVMHTYGADRKKIFVTGMSAGGVMAHNLAVCYPDYFKGVAIHSGLSYKIAENLEEAQTVLTIQDQKSPEYLGKQAYACGRNHGKGLLSQIMIIHGSEDKRVHAIHSDIISRTNEVWWDYLDDGIRNSSGKPKVTRTSTRTAQYTVTKTEKYFPHRNMVEQKIIVNGMAHAWGGGKPVSANFDPKAPSSTDTILKFFQLK